MGAPDAGDAIVAGIIIVAMVFVLSANIVALGCLAWGAWRHRRR